MNYLGYHRLCRMLLLAVLFVVINGTVTGAAQKTASMDNLEEEAVSLLSRYIQINTTNPPGDEIKAARFFKEIFDREGIEARIIESAPGRGNIYARLRGSGAKKAVMLLNHLDVVPADAKLWKEPPFSGAVKDGYIWGRGALDMKGPAIVELMTILALKRNHIPLQGDVIFLGTADEEAGGALGAGYLLEKHPELFKNVGLVLNEGGGVRLSKDGKVLNYSVSVAEKTPLWLRLTASGTPGHGSTPGVYTAVSKLVAALGRVMAYQAPIKVVPEVQKFFADMADAEPEARGKLYRDLQTSLEDPAFAAEFTKNPRNNASVRNTIAITGLRGSDKINVVPAQASAEIDVRLLPGEDPQEFIAGLRRLIADETMKIEVLLSFPAAISPPHPEAMKVIQDLAKTQDSGAPVVAPLVRGFTDCHFFREKGIPCLGFMPLRNLPSEQGIVHGVNERISLDSLRSG
ncbi:MAG: M20/M25/M40 family metallo-hydrolase, partial [Deltaproteobacteria bacterium]|nr:M20/M25/M40 family metallo-hydrolase [Deltaproteobacteria bacterium]